MIALFVREEHQTEFDWLVGPLRVLDERIDVAAPTE